ncbi:hypothetical protein [Chitinophaga sp.]|uniref:hypothetical protein n=1 Tax=Chitinophaga sp. TaxID=1869181 RepID=UPI00262D94CF|nr:hypothetical protein [uncultured Chitinophaga sp.]
MHTQQFIPLAIEDMRLTTGGNLTERAGELPTLPPVRITGTSDAGALRTEAAPGPQVDAPGLAVAEMMRNR